MDIYRGLERLDEYLMDWHGKATNRLNDLFGWGNFQIAKALNYGRWSFLIPGSALSFYSFHQEGELIGPFGTNSIIIVYPIVIGAVTSLFNSKYISAEEKKSKYTGSTVALPLEHFLSTKRTEMLSYLLLFGGFFAGFGIIGLSLGYLGSAASDISSAANFLLTISVQYIAANHNKPKKGKLAETLEGLYERAKSVVRSPLPQPSPASNIVHELYQE